MSDDTSPNKPLRLYPVYFNEESLNNGPPMPENVKKFLLAMRELQLQEWGQSAESESKAADD